jgi:hypothetical protein
MILLVLKKRKSGFLMNTMKMVMKNEERKKTKKSKINQVLWFIIRYHRFARSKGIDLRKRSNGYN